MLAVIAPLRTSNDSTRPPRPRRPGRQFFQPAFSQDGAILMQATWVASRGRAAFPNPHYADARSADVRPRGSDQATPFHRDVSARSASAPAIAPRSARPGDRAPSTSNVQPVARIPRFRSGEGAASGGAARGRSGGAAEDPAAAGGIGPLSE